MGWAFGENAEGREIGYGVVATCDFPGCTEEIDRGLAYLCGDPPYADEWGCGKYFCPKHRHNHDCPYPEEEEDA